MKKFYLFLIAFVAITAQLWAYDFSYTYQGQTLYYNIVDGNARVTCQNASSPFYTTYPTGSLTIPSSVTYNGTTYSVTSIGNYAFYGCSGLTDTLTIPNSVTSIGEGAFSDCSGLTSLTIGNSVTSIGVIAFTHCEGLTGTLTIPNSVTSIDYGAFSGCSGLTSLTIGNSVTSIGEATFSGCSGLTEIHSLNPVPPTAGVTGGYGTFYSAFEGIPTNIPVYIPCGRVSYYTAAQDWSRFTNFIEASAASFSAVSNNNTMGSVQILTMPTCTNPQAVVYAVANSGYQFDHWSDNSTSNPYSLTVNEDMVLTAYFKSIGGTEGIDDITSDQIKIYSRGSEIVIEGADNSDALIYDVMGRIVHKGRIESPIHVNNMGVYMVKVGDQQPRKVIVR